METLSKAGFKKKVFDFDAHPDCKFAGTRPAIVDFHADWCGPYRALAAMFGARRIPSLPFIPKAGPPTMAGGFMPKDRLKEVISPILGIK